MTVNQSEAKPASRTPAHTRPPADLLDRARSVLQRNTADLRAELPTPPTEASADTPRPAAAEPWTDCELRIVVNHRLREACNAGRPPSSTRAWLAAARAQELANETAKPGWIRRCAAGIQAAQHGKRITGWRWERGTHSGGYVRDPYGTDDPPRGTT